jgi:hypothetical protein
VTPVGVQRQRLQDQRRLTAFVVPLGVGDQVQPHVEKEPQELPPRREAGADPRLPVMAVAKQMRRAAPHQRRFAGAQIVPLPVDHQSQTALANGKAFVGIGVEMLASGSGQHPAGGDQDIEPEGLGVLVHVREHEGFAGEGIAGRGSRRG